MLCAGISSTEVILIQLNLSTRATLGTDKMGHYREVAIVGRWPLMEIHL